MMSKKIKRCPWPGNKPKDVAYHDNEWGVPLHEDRKLFEFMVLDAFQAGLSWSTIINKRENLSKAFDNFEPAIIAKYDEKKVEQLLNDIGIIRNRLKIRSTITNAKLFLETQMWVKPAAIESVEKTLLEFQNILLEGTEKAP